MKILNNNCNLRGDLRAAVLAFVILLGCSVRDDPRKSALQANASRLATLVTRRFVSLTPEAWCRMQIGSSNALFELTPDRWRVWRKSIQSSEFSDNELDIDSEIFSILFNVRCLMELNCCDAVLGSGVAEKEKCNVRFLVIEKNPTAGEKWPILFMEERYLDTSTGIQVVK
jgi:hypothetical protein